MIESWIIGVLMFLIFPISFFLFVMFAQKFFIWLMKIKNRWLGWIAMVVAVVVVAIGNNTLIGALFFLYFSIAF